MKWADARLMSRSVIPDWFWAHNLYDLWTGVRTLLAEAEYR